MASMLKKISIWGYLHNKKVFCYKHLSIFIIHQNLIFGGIALKIEFVVFVYELINHEIIFKPGVRRTQAGTRLVS